MRLTTILRVSLVALVTTAGAACAANTPHRLLRKIKSPLELVRDALPTRYRAPVQLSGTVAAQISSALATQKLPAPRYEETMEKPGVFSFELANDDYPLDTREMIAGVLNPAGVIDMIMRSVVRYHDPDTFARISRETVASLAAAPSSGPAAVAITLTPIAGRFGYSFEDAGSSVSESWLASLTVVMDTVDMLVHELVMRRGYREYAMEQTQKPPARESLVRYELGYTTVGGKTLPSDLSLSINDTLALMVTARYRVEQSNVVFDRRTVCNQASSAARECLEMTYGAYQIGASARVRSAPTVAKSTTRDIEKAAQLTREAAEAMRTGSIRAAFRILQRMATDYAGTPQGIEARKLLEGIPRGL